MANVVATTAAIVAGSAWFLAGIYDYYSGPWAATAAGALIGLSVALFSRATAIHRTSVATMAYLLVLLTVLMLLTHHGLVEIYGGIENFQAYEQSLVRSRLQDPIHLVAYGLGGLLAAVLPAINRRG